MAPPVHKPGIEMGDIDTMSRLAAHENPTMPSVQKRCPTLTPTTMLSLPHEPIAENIADTRPTVNPPEHECSPYRIHTSTPRLERANPCPVLLGNMTRALVVGTITYLTASLNTVSYLYSHSTSASTARTYSTAEKRWFAVTDKIGTDPRMQTVPDEWHHRTDELRTTTITWEESCIVIFVASALQQQKPLAPRTISTYLSGAENTWA